MLATDLDTRFLAHLEHSNLRTQQHNIVTDELPEAEFDLIHTRSVLQHLSDSDKALDRLVNALRPGGWLLVEDPDFCSWIPTLPRDPEVFVLFTTASADVFQFMAGVGSDFFFGRRLPQALRARGLVDVAADGRVSMLQCGSQPAQIFSIARAKLRDRIVESGLLSLEALEAFIALHDDPDFEWMGPVMVTARGRKPPR